MKNFNLFTISFIAVLIYFLCPHAEAQFKTVYSLSTPKEESTYILDTKSIVPTVVGATAGIEVGYKDKAVIMGKTPVRFTLQKVSVNCNTNAFSVNNIQYYDINNMLLRAVKLPPVYRAPRVNSGQAYMVASVCDITKKKNNLNSLDSSLRRL